MLTQFKTKRKEEKHLPEKSTSFIGRKEEIEQAISLIVEKVEGIVWIVGGPGFGKTTTAVEIAHALYDDHNIPVFFADLRVATTVLDVIVRVCHGMGVHPQQDPKTSLIFALNGLINNRVLVMDNIEQLTTKDDFVDLLRSLRMQSSQHLQIMLTSSFHFPVVDLKSEVITLPILKRELSVQLVRKCHPEKCLNESFVNNLASLCGDVPLALCVAATRIQDVPDPDQLLEWLKKDAMEVLKTPEEPIVEKSIAMSFNILTNEQQNYLVRLSVFSGSFCKRAVGAIIGLTGVELQNFLTLLVNRNLIERRNDRYSILTLIASFLRKCKSCTGNKFSSERNLAQRRMVKYFLERANELTLLYWSKDGSTDARRLLQEDTHNIDSVSQLCRESLENKSSNPDILQLLRESMIYQSSSRFFYHFVIHVMTQDSVKSFLEVCIATARQHGDAAVELLAQCLIAHVVGRTCGWKSQESIKSINDAKVTFGRNEESLEEKSKLEARSYYWYNQCVHEEESGEKARSHLQNYLQELKRNGGQSRLEEVDVAITLLQLGRVHWRRASKSDAVRCYEEALEHFERLLGDHDLKLCCHKELGDLHLEQGEPEKAVAFYEDAMKVHRKLGAGNFNLSSVYLLKNYGLLLPCVAESLVYQREALDVAEKLFPDHRRCKTEIYCGLAETFDKYESGCEKAVEFANKALVGLQGQHQHSSNLMGVDVEFEKMRNIIAKGIKPVTI